MIMIPYEDVEYYGVFFLGLITMNYDSPVFGYHVL